ESEESEKMDEDSKIIDDLREINEHQRVQISHLEKALKQAIGGQEEIKMSNNNELKKAKETIDELNRKLAGCMTTIDAKNMEVLNLQTALGQYYAEIEAKVNTASWLNEDQKEEERLCEELSVAKEESARLSKQLKEAHQEAEASKREKEEILGKLSQAERMLAEGKNRVKKLEEDNEKLRRALEQSMTRLNRMSVDSDFLVDRRIVIKLLVTYFQRNHSKEVLDLMVRMLGFSDEDKQRIGLAQQGAGKGVVRGVLGLPGRLVGGILRGGSAETHTTMASDNQSIADLWVDFLLNETEREKRESASAASSSSPDYSTTGTASPLPDHRGNTAAVSDFRRPSLYLNENTTLSPSRGTFLQHEHSDSEFSTVPLLV
ncbi:UNVERIFIED_CONTAM: Golgin candidate 4, partial [Sesamum indicum]